MNMKSNVYSLIKASGWASIVIYLGLYYFNNPSNFSEYIELIPEAIGYATIFSFVYEKWLWKYNCFLKIPKLKVKYFGVIEYNFNDYPKKKDVVIFVKQSLLSVNVKIETDQITSKSITSELIEEDGGYVLYYTYRTNPLNRVIEKNPIQFGTCRLLLEDVNHFHGQYWTSNKTRGDIYFNLKEES